MIRVERGEGLIRLTATKGTAHLPPLLVEEAGPLAWRGCPPHPRSDL